jgi:hypothetical protein
MRRTQHVRGVRFRVYHLTCGRVALKDRSSFRCASYAAVSYPEEQVTLCENTVEARITLPSGKGKIYTIIVK